MKMFVLFTLIGLVALVAMLFVVVPQADHRANLAAKQRATHLEKMGW